MKSIERQLRSSLAIIMIIILLGLVLIANISTRILLEEFVTTRLNIDAKSILNALKYSQQSTKVRPRRINPVYNTLGSGHYYFIRIKYKSGKEQSLHSPSLDSIDIPAHSSSAPLVLHNVSGPNGEHLIVWMSTYKIDGQTVTISVAEDMSMLKQHRQYFTLLFISAGFLGVVLILVFQRAVIRKAFESLDATRIEVKEIESGKLHQLSENVPSEIFPLVSEYNHGLSLIRKRLQHSRNSLGNLAHALKTPLSLLIQQLDRFEGIANEAQQDTLPQMKAQTERIHQLMERELKRAGMAGLGSSNQRFNPYEELPVLIDVIKQSHQNDKLDVVLNIEKSVGQFGDREDMLELIGNLMDNAFKWALSRVNFTISKNNSEISIIIEDDGPGRKEHELQSLSLRGVRLDESQEGHGLGLSICKDIVVLYAGSISFARSERLGGFLVKVILPNQVSQNASE